MSQQKRVHRLSRLAWLCASVFPVLISHTQAQTPPPVPPGYQDLYGSLTAQIAQFSAQIPPPGNNTPAFSAELVLADSARGSQVITQPYSGVLNELDSLKAMGVQAVSVEVHFPILYPGYYQNPADYQQYVTFYSQLASDIRARGLKLIVETGIVLNEPGVTQVDLQPYYNSLTLDQYQQGRAQTAVVVAQVLKPDYLSVLNEPDTEAAQSGFSALGTVSGSVGMLNTILNDLQQAGVSNVPIGAGIGSWLPGYDAFLRAYASMPIQFLDLHIFPINQAYLSNAFNAASIAQGAGKGLAVSQAWLQKVRDSELGVLSFPQLAARDPFSFWEPADESFLEAMVAFAQAEHVAYITPYFTLLFHANLDYSVAGNLPVDQVETQLNEAAAASIPAAQYSILGRAYSAMIIGQPDTTAPSAPSGLTATAQSSSVISLVWTAATDNVGVAGYQIYRNGVQIATTINTSFFDQSLSPITTYTYSIAAFDVAGNVSAQSSPVSCATQVLANNAPSIPGGLTATAVSSGEIDINWSVPVSGNPVAGYVLYRGLSLSSLSQLTNVAGTSYADTQVNPTTTYYYAVLAFDAASEQSGLSNTVSATTPQEPPPTVPAQVAGMASAYNQVNLTWAASTSSSGVGGYLILRGTTSSGLTQVASTVAPAFVDTQVGPSTNYYYAIVAYDLLGLNSPASNTISISTPREPAPSIPGQLSAVASSFNQVNLAWAASTSPVGVNGYLIYRGTSASSLGLIGTSTATAFTDSSLTPSTTYFYAVAANDNYGLPSAPSAAVPLTTPQEPPPSTPAQVTAQSPAFNQVNLTWAASTGASGISGYVVFRGPSLSALAPIAKASGTAFTDSNTSPSTAYFYAVASVDGFGLQSALSSPISITTPQQPPPSIPGQVTALAVAYNQVNLSWAPSTSSLGIGGYVVYRGTSPSALTQIGSSTSSAFVDNHPAPATGYFYAVAAYDVLQLFSGQSSIVSVATPREPAPTVPSQLAAQSPSYSQINLAWAASTSPVGIGGYLVYRGSAPANLTLIGQTVSAAFADSQLAPATTYYYAVAAFDTYGLQSASSSSLTAVTQQAPPITVPSQLTAQATAFNQVNLSWAPSVSAYGIWGYVIYRGTSPGNVTAIASGPATTFTDTHVAPSTTYYYAVMAYNNKGIGSAQTSPVAAAVPQEPAPSTPSQVAGQASYNQVVLTWTPSSSPLGIGGYIVSRGTSLANVTPIAASPTAAYTDKGVGPSTAYYYQVQAYDVYGLKSSLTPVFAVTTAQEAPPSVPSQVVAQASAYNQVNLAWTASTGPLSVYGYVIYRSTTAASLSAVGFTLTTSYTDKGLAPSANYYYAIAAVDIRGLYSSQSTPLSIATPQEPAPSTPSGISAQTPNRTQIVLNWTPSTSPLGIGGYLVYKGISPTSLILVAATSAPTYSDTVAPATTYYYALVAYDVYGLKSAQSSPVAVTTPQ